MWNFMRQTTLKMHRISVCLFLLSVSRNLGQETSYSTIEPEELLSTFDDFYATYDQNFTYDPDLKNLRPTTADANISSASTEKAKASRKPRTNTPPSAKNDQTSTLSSTEEDVELWETAVPPEDTAPHLYDAPDPWTPTPRVKIFTGNYTRNPRYPVRQAVNNYTPPFHHEHYDNYQRIFQKEGNWPNQQHNGQQYNAPLPPSGQRPNPQMPPPGQRPNPQMPPPSSFPYAQQYGPDSPNPYAQQYQPYGYGPMPPYGQPQGPYYGPPSGPPPQSPTGQRLPPSQSPPPPRSPAGTPPSPSQQSPPPSRSPAGTPLPPGPQSPQTGRSSAPPQSPSPNQQPPPLMSELQPGSNQRYFNPQQRYQYGPYRQYRRPFRPRFNNYNNDTRQFSNQTGGNYSQPYRRRFQNRWRPPYYYNGNQHWQGNPYYQQQPYPNQPEPLQGNQPYPPQQQPPPPPRNWEPRSYQQPYDNWQQAPNQYPPNQNWQPQPGYQPPNPNWQSNQNGDPNWNPNQFPHNQRNRGWQNTNNPSYPHHDPRMNRPRPPPPGGMPPPPYPPPP